MVVYQTNPRRYLNLEGQLYDQIPSYFRVKVNSLLMLKARGYIVTPEEESLIPIQQGNCISGTEKFDAYRDYNIKLDIFRSFHRQMTSTNNFSLGRNISNNYTHSANPEDKVHVCFVDSDPNKKAPSAEMLANYVSLYWGVAPADFGKLKVIFVVVKGINSPEVLNLNMLGLKYEIFTHGQLMIIPTEHTFSSIYRRLTQEEASTIYNKENMKPRDLPVLTSDDPIVRYYGWSPGDLIMVERINSFTEGTIGVSIYYRLVSHGVMPPK